MSDVSTVNWAMHAWFCMHIVTNNFMFIAWSGGLFIWYFQENLIYIQLVNSKKANWVEVFAKEIGFIISTPCNSVQLTDMSQMNLNVNLSYSPNDHEWNFFNLSLLISLKRHIRLIETSMSNPVYLPLCQYLLPAGW